MPSYKNLVFKGGGVRGIAYVGALKYLYENGLTRSLERVAGTSAGAITALVLALNPEGFGEIKRIADSLDYRKVPSEGEHPEQAEQGEAGSAFARAAQLWQRSQSLGIVKNMQCTMRLVQDKGWYSSDYFYNWLKEVIAARFAAGKKAYTFADFADPSLHKGGRPFLDLHVTGTDISNRTSRLFSAETTPDMEVALAVRISMSIPLFFEAIPFQYPGTPHPQVYADGGVMWNYPLSVFDDPKYCRRLDRGMNPETLGLFLYSSPEATVYKEVKGMADYVGALFESLLLVQERLVLYGEKNKGRTIFISDEGIPSTDFDLAPGDGKYAKLFDSGYRAASEFFDHNANWDLMLNRLQKRFGWKGAHD